MARYVEDRRDCTLFVSGTLDSLLPADSMARTLWGALIGLDFGGFELRYCNEQRGRPAIDPRRLVAVWILSLVRGNTSSVGLARLCAEDLEFRWLMGGASVKKTALSDFRKNYVTELSDLSTQVLGVLARMGLLPAERICVDGTVIRAAASCSANCTHKQLKRRIVGLRKRIRTAYEEPESSATEVQALAQRAERLEDALAEMTQLGLTDSKDRMTLTEPDAPKRKLKTHNFAPAHNVQVTTDLDSSAVIEVDVIDQGNDPGQLAPQFEKARDALERIGQKVAEEAQQPGPIRAGAADSAYHDTRQLKALEEQGVRTFVPNKRANRRPPGVSDAFLASEFTYIPDNDTMICPMGCPMKYRKLNPNGTAAVYEAHAKTCLNCPHKHECCPTAKGGRCVSRPRFPELLDTIRERTESDEGMRMRKARSVSGEGAISRLVEFLHWRRCRTWGRLGARAEARWRQIAHNLMLATGLWRPLVLRTPLA